MEDLNKVKEITKYVLSEYPQTRGDDIALIYHFIATLAKTKMPNEYRGNLGYIIHELGGNLQYIQKYMGIHSFEGITRCRRKLQAQYDDLKPTEEAKKARKEKEKHYKETIKEWKKN